MTTRKTYFFRRGRREKTGERKGKWGRGKTFIKCKCVIETLDEVLVVKYKFFYTKILHVYMYVLVYNTYGRIRTLALQSLGIACKETVRVGAEPSSEGISIDLGENSTEDRTVTLRLYTISLSTWNVEPLYRGLEFMLDAKIGQMSRACKRSYSAGGSGIAHKRV